MRYTEDMIDPLLKQFLEELDKFLNKKIDILIVGGNALVLYNCKKFTEDIDLCVEGRDVDIYDWALRYRKTTGIRVDTFVDGWFKTLKMPDFMKRGLPSKVIKLRNINLYLMNIEDIILTKVDRGNEKDNKDIKSILNKMKIKRKNLEDRFQFCLRNFNGDNSERQRFTENFKNFLLSFGNKLFKLLL